jgi:tRNA A37 threonylcarbamoyladenosine biosynthesis protein TsaE
MLFLLNLFAKCKPYPAAEYTLQFINQTQRSIFLTGKAGTGETTLLREIIETTHKNTVVVAPTELLP